MYQIYSIEYNNKYLYSLFKFLHFRLADSLKIIKTFDIKRRAGFFWMSEEERLKREEYLKLR